MAGPDSVSPGDGNGNPPVADGAAGLRGLRHQQPSVVEGGNRLGYRLAGKVGALASEKFLDGPGGEDQAEVAIENEDGVFQVLQQVVDVAAQIRNFELRAAQPLAQQIDFRGHHRKFVGGGLVGGQNFGFVFAAGDPIQHVSDVAQRAEQGHGEQKGQQDGARNGENRHFRLLIESLLERRTNQHRGDDHAHPERA